MKKIIKLYLPDYGKIMSVNRKNYRSQSNVWIVDNIKEVISRKKYDKTNKNQVIFNKS